MARPTDWDRVGQLIKARRESLRLKQHEAVALADGGISVATWRNVETANKPPFRQASLLAVCRALGWTPDSIDRILAGGEPLLVGDTRATPESIDEKLDRIEASLAELRQLIAAQRNDATKSAT